MALTVIQAPPPCGDSEHRAESVSPSTTLRMASSKQQQQRSPSPGSVLLTSATSATIEGRRVTAPQPPHVSLQVTASTMNARYLMLLLNWFVGGLFFSPPPSPLCLLGFPASLAKIMYSRHKARSYIVPPPLLPSFLPFPKAARRTMDQNFWKIFKTFTKKEIIILKKKILAQLPQPKLRTE